MTDRQLAWTLIGIAVMGCVVFGFFAAAPWLIGPLGY